MMNRRNALRLHPDFLRGYGFQGSGFEPRRNAL
jgi:hypothetical protein